MPSIVHLHFIIATTLTLLSITISMVYEPSNELQIMLLLLLAGCLGIPHGLTDMLLLQHFPQFWQKKSVTTLWVTGFIIYCLISALMWFLWWFVPLVAFLIFIILSLYHFGIEDNAAHGHHEHLHPFILWLHGAFLIFVPLAAHSETVLYFSQLSHTDWSEIQKISPYIAGLAGGILLLNSFRHSHYMMVTELLVLFILFLMVKPLLSFTIYFCIWHTPRHYLRSATKPYIRKFIIIIICISVISMMVALSYFYQFQLEKLQNNYIYLDFFKLLGCIVAPHVILAKLTMRK
jgi:Brp/Blh family beta-carotene 15,15'-monooxygenase